MGRVAFELSDTIIVTSDNPRSEDPQSIIDDILEGLPLPSERVIQEVDRKKAIEMAVDRAKPGDVIVVAGKGHEDYQIIGGQRHHFSDYEILKSLLTVIDKEES